MKISTLEDFLKFESRGREFMEKKQGKESSDKFYSEKYGNRDKLKEEFPFSVVLEGWYPEHDIAEKWLWEKFGSFKIKECMNCYSEYPCCPFVLLTKTINKHDEVEYTNPGFHSHDGIWTYFWLGKTGYDEGFNEYLFKNEADLEVFKSICETLGLGENYKS